MTRNDIITDHNGRLTTIAQLAIELGRLAVSNKLRHGIQPVLTVYTMYDDYPINERVIVMAKVKPPGGFNLLELKTVEAVNEFVSKLEIVE